MEDQSPKQNCQLVIIGFHLKSKYIREPMYKFHEKWLLIPKQDMHIETHISHE